RQGAWRGMLLPARSPLKPRRSGLVGRLPSGIRAASSGGWRRSAALIMHLETLQVFCDLVESGSFSAAAAQNFITQSAVSQQIRSLEARFDRPLLERTKGHVQPTPAGQLLYQASKDITQRYRELREQMQSFGSVVSGSVRLATVHSVGLYELSEPL